MASFNRKEPKGDQTIPTFAALASLREISESYWFFFANFALFAANSHSSRGTR